MLTAERTLTELELVIQHGLMARLMSYIEVGEALEEIREGKLYRDKHATFEAYCKKQWGWSKTHVNRQIQAAEVARNLTPIGVNLPVNEGQARELSSLTLEQQVQVASAVKFAEATAADVREAAADIKGDSVHFSSESPEWYTPPEIIARVVTVLGAIDTDPCADANKGVPAGQHFTKDDDGLAQDWTGRVYMNPPYGRPIVQWTEKLVSEFRAGRVTEAVALVPARVDTDWFRGFRDFAVCFIDGRLKFSGHENSAPFPSALVYIGGDIDKFNRAFSEVGDVWIRWAS